MEKINGIPPLPVFVTGPESTGKTVLTSALANHYARPWVPEYARAFIQLLDRPYTWSDVEQIARTQVSQLLTWQDHFPVFFDTGLIITKVWFEEVYGNTPEWLDHNIRLLGNGIYLLCYPDLPWEPDPVRENPHRREYLFKRYQSAIDDFGYQAIEVRGYEERRIVQAIRSLDAIFVHKSE